MFREWKALFLEGLPIYEDEVVYLTFYSLNSSFNDREQSQVLFWCCVLLVHSRPIRTLGARDFSRADSVFGYVLIMTRVKRSKTKQKINLCKLFGNSIYSDATQTSLSLILLEGRGDCT